MQLKTVGSMATFPGREKTLEMVASRLTGQLDTLYIYLNEYKKIPDFLEKYDNIIPILGLEAYGDLNANGKMIYLEYERENCIVFTLDDDILYPDDYVKVMKETIATMNYKVALTVHGSIIPDTASWYYERTHVLGAKKAFATHQAVNLIGSGTFVYMLDSIPLEFINFTKEVWVDLQISLAAFSNEVPLMAVKRDSEWIEFIKYPGLWEQFKVDLTHHTRFLQSSKVWRLEHLKNVWRSFLDSETDQWLEYIYENKIEYDFCASVFDGTIPMRWCGNAISLQKAQAFANDIK